MFGHKHIKKLQKQLERRSPPKNNLGKKTNRFLKVALKNLARSLLLSTRNLRNPNWSKAGFVLPTVTMVMLVVILLTIAISLRSFDRARDANNARVSGATLSAAAPALERARAKINYLLYEDPTLPLSTPTDKSIKVFLENQDTNDKYTFGDETRLKIKLDLGSGPDWKTTPEVEDDEEITTAWRFPVDTNNDGKYDSFTLYSILYRSPPRKVDTNKFDRERNGLEARTPPMSKLEVVSDQDCKLLNTSASLIGSSGWYQSNGVLKKSFFIYVATVPITNVEQENLFEALEEKDKSDEYQGTRGASFLEYQQDHTRVPLTNNAVIYEDDLEISPGPEMILNGRIVSNSNFIVTYTDRGPLSLYQVSSPKSCYYQEENSKITVGGNVVNGSSLSSTQTQNVRVDLFPGTGIKPSTSNGSVVEITRNNQSVSEDSLNVMYNNQAYTTRIAALVKAQMAKTIDKDPSSFKLQLGTVYDQDSPDRRKALEAYFRSRTRKVPFAEVALDGNGLTPATCVDSSDTTRAALVGESDDLRPCDNWMLPTSTNLTLRLGQLKATQPEKQEQLRKEQFLGDRILVGNNLPALRYEGGEFVGKEQKQFLGSGKNWDDPNTEERYRVTQIKELPSVGATDRDGFWERAAAVRPETQFDSVGGLRVVTGAGVYERKYSFLPPPKVRNPDGNISQTYDDPATTAVETYTIVWPDTMPMSPVAATGVQVYDNVGNAWVVQASATDKASPLADTTTIDPKTEKYAKGDLRMRATAVYHYATDPVVGDVDQALSTYSDKDQKPIACISSYYDPSYEFGIFDSRKNLTGLPYNADANGKSNNGVVYTPPKSSRPTSAATLGSDGLLTGLTSGTDAKLQAQANMVFPDGRFVNPQLREALQHVGTDDFSLADQGAIDSTLCSLDILNPPGGFQPDQTIIPHGAIEEVAFLNSREIKAIDKDNTATPVNETYTLSSPLSGQTGEAKLSGKYDLPIEERQPLEIRATKLNLDVMRQTAKVPQTTNGPKNSGGQEYLLPYSGIIYATRDDALPDRSYRVGDTTKGLDKDTSEIVSPTDSRLDPTRRPNGILLVNGKQLARGGGSGSYGSLEDVVKEKGLTLASNLPVYIQGNFNVHTQKEFTDPDTTAFYDRATPNPDFACRVGDPRLLGSCTVGDDWRAATILADSLTVLSGATNATAGFWFGTRDDGDFDLRNNAGDTIVGYDLNGNGTIKSSDSGSESAFGIDFNRDGDKTDTVAETEITATDARLLNGFRANNYVTSRIFNDSQFSRVENAAARDNSSYFTNFVTPVQRRVRFPRFLMEMCLKRPLFACGPADWVVNGTGTKASTTATNIQSGTTGSTSSSEVPDNYQRYPRRVAFKRSTSNLLDISTDGGKPVVFGMQGNTIKEVKQSNYANMCGSSSHIDCSTDNHGLWFTTNKSGTRNFGYGFPLYYEQDFSAVSPLWQPLLQPVLQVYAIRDSKASSQNPGADLAALLTSQNMTERTNWLPRASGNTEVNVIVGAGDVPARKLTGSWGEFSGGMQNLPRLLENWDQPAVNLKIGGAFIQLNRSKYATAPYQAILQTETGTTAKSLFGTGFPDKYRTGVADGRAPYFSPPNRQFGFDPGLLSQSPDLFAQKFTVPPTKTEPDEFYREVDRNDDWVKSLLCAEINSNDGKAVNENIRPSDCSS